MDLMTNTLLTMSTSIPPPPTNYDEYIVIGVEYNPTKRSMYLGTYNENLSLKGIKNPEV